MTRDGNPPPDIHNGQIFLAKFQMSLGTATNAMIYDRQRSFQLFWFRATNPELFDQARTMMGSIPKFYRWVRRVGDYEMEVCLDRAPQSDPLW